MLDFRSLWSAALPFDRFLAESTEQRSLWDGVYRHAQVPPPILESVPAGVRLRLLVLAEDWCGDAANTVPVLQRFAEAKSGVDLRILRRDEHPDVMDRYLTRGARAIPIVIVLDNEFGELGFWGPRPEDLQAWVMAHKDTMPKDERYKEIRRWYARDRGVTTLCEVLRAAALSCGKAA